MKPNRPSPSTPPTDLRPRAPAQQAPAVVEPPTQPNAHAAGELMLLPYEKVVASDTNPRTSLEKEALDELVRSIHETPTGLLQPITVRPRGEVYELVAGSRRFAAMKILHEAHPKDPRYAKVPCIVRQIDDATMPVIQLIENLHRSDLTPIEVADGLAKAMQDGRTSEADLCRQLGWSSRTMKKYLQLHHAPGWLKDFGKHVDVPVTKRDERGEPVIDPKTNKEVVVFDKRAPLQFTLLMEVVGFHAKLKKWDKQQYDEDGSHKLRADDLTRRTVFACASEGWSLARLQDELKRRYAATTGERAPAKPADTATKPKAPFVATDKKLSLDVDLVGELTAPQRADLAKKATLLFKALGFETVVINA